MDNVATGLEHLGQLECEDASVGIAGNRVRAVWLLLLDGLEVHCQNVFQSIEGAFAWVEPACTETVNGSVWEVLNQPQEDKNFADTGVNEPQRSLSTLVLESHNWIIFIFISRALNAFNGGGERADSSVGQHSGHRHLGDTKSFLGYALELDEIDGVDASVKDQCVSTHLSFIKA